MIMSLKKKYIVYFVLAPKTNMVKIGRANDLDKRLKGLQTGCPEILNVLLVLHERPPFEETQLHHRFRKLRAHGEWFEYRAELKEFIQAKQANPEPTPYDDVALREEGMPLSRIVYVVGRGDVCIP